MRLTNSLTILEEPVVFLSLSCANTLYDVPFNASLCTLDESLLEVDLDFDAVLG